MTCFVVRSFVVHSCVVRSFVVHSIPPKMWIRSRAAVKITDRKRNCAIVPSALQRRFILFCVRAKDDSLLATYVVTCTGVCTLHYTYIHTHTYVRQWLQLAEVLIRRDVVWVSGKVWTLSNNVWDQTPIIPSSGLQNIHCIVALHLLFLSYQYHNTNCTHTNITIQTVLIPVSQHKTHVHATSTRILTLTFSIMIFPDVPLVSRCEVCRPANQRNNSAVEPSNITVAISLIKLEWMTEDSLCLHASNVILSHSTFHQCFSLHFKTN
jgi:hypothetical protein